MSLLRIEAQPLAQADSPSADHLALTLGGVHTQPCVSNTTSAPRRTASVRDGMHRICKALLLGHEDIEAARFENDPDPDYIGVHPDDLPY